MKTLKVKLLSLDAKLPTRSHSEDAGLDLYTLEERKVNPGEGWKFSTGIACEIPKGHYLHIHTRSSMAKKGWAVVGGIVDSGYTGECFVMLRNVSNDVLFVEKYDRIAQAILYPIVTPKVEQVNELSETERGEGSFGSSGS